MRTSKMLETYILDADHRPVPAAIGSAEYLAFMGDMSKRRVAETTEGDFWVSTVFLGIDHSFGDAGPPLFFETMVQNTKTTHWAGPDGEEIQERCETWGEAIAQHERVVEQLRRDLAGK